MGKINESRERDCSMAISSKIVSPFVTAAVIQPGGTRLQSDQRLVALISTERFGFLKLGFEFSQKCEKLLCLASQLRDGLKN